MKSLYAIQCLHALRGRSILLCVDNYTGNYCIFFFIKFHFSLNVYNNVMRNYFAFADGPALRKVQRLMI